MSALTDEDNVDLRVVPRTALRAAAGEDLAPDGDDDSDPDVQEEQTGAMIALLPSAEDAARLALAGGETPDELHLTLVYLGDVSSWDLQAQATVVQRVTEMTAGMRAVVADVFGAALWNPAGTSPAVVLNVGGDCLEDVQAQALGCLYEWPSPVELPEQHEPWSPHVCVAYTDQLSTLGQAVALVGSVVFDRVRVAFGGQYADLPLLPPEVTVTDQLTAAAPAASGTADPGVGGVGQTDLPGSPATVGFAGATAGWRGILVVEGEQTGDGRMFAEGSLTWAEPPLPLSWQRQSVGGHDGSVIAARIDNVWRDPTDPRVIWGSGVFDADGVDGAEALRQVRDLFLQGVSVDVDNVKNSDVELVFPPADSEDPMEAMFAEPDLTIFHGGRVRGATLVALPAFTQARIELTDDTAPALALPTTSDGPSGAAAPAMAAVDDAWDGGATEALLASTMSLDVARGAYAWVDLAKARSGGVHKLHGRFLHHHVSADGQPSRANVTACSVGVGALLSNPRLAMSMAERRAAYEHLAGHLRAAGLTPQAFTAEGLTDDVRSLYASAAVDELGAPPDEAFDDPGFDGPTPTHLVASADGRWQLFRGHAALSGTCHVSFPGACVTPPHEDYHAYYRLGEVVTASGARVPVGTVTLGTGHAPSFGTSPQAAMEHYDDTGTGVAIVASGTDAYGIWVAGVVKPGTPAGRVTELAAAKLSGDWRRIGGQLRLVAMLAVNVPGFPVPRVRAHVVDGRQLSLVASGLVPDAAALTAAANRDAVQQMARKLAKRVGRDPASRAAALRARVHRGEVI